MKLEIAQYPYKKDCALAITIDDLHPEGKEEKEGRDFGFNFQGIFWQRIDKLFEIFPEIRVTLFTVASWKDRSDFPGGIFWPFRKVYRQRREYLERKFSLEKDMFSYWITELNKRVEKGNVEIAFHGLEHHSRDKAVAQSQEFSNISESETTKKINKMVDIFERAGLRYGLGFRAPGWGINSYLVTALKKKHFLYTANNSDFVSSVTDNKAGGAGLMGQLLYQENYDAKIINFTANCYPHQVERAVAIAKKRGIILVHAHITATTFGLKYVDSYFTQNIQNIIREIRSQTLGHIWFAGLEEMSKFFLAKKVLQIKELQNEVFEFSNPSQFSLNGLTIFCKGDTFVIDHIPAESKLLFTPFSMKEENKVSVVLTVFNGERTLEASLNSLLNQSYYNKEVIVVNDGSTDRTKEILEKYTASVNYPYLRIIHQKNKGRSQARNNGWKIATGDIITFCEDDAFYDKEYLAEATRVLLKGGPKMAGVIGPHYVWNRNETIMTRVKDIERRRNFLDYHPQSVWFYWKKLFEELGGFNEKLEFGEDIEPAIQLKKRGYVFGFAPEARWLHREPGSLQAYLRRKFKGGVGMSLLKKEKLKKNLIPPREKFFVFFAILLLLSFVIMQPMYLLYIIPFCFLILGFVRFPAVYKVKKITNENIFFCDNWRLYRIYLVGHHPFRLYLWTFSFYAIYK